MGPRAPGASRPTRTPPHPGPLHTASCESAAGCPACSSLPAPYSGSACAFCGPGYRRVPVAEHNVDTLAAVCTVLGLGPAWIPVLQHLRDDLSEPLAWRRRFLAETEPLTFADLRLVAVRMQGLGPTRIARRVGRRSIPPRHQIDRICLAVAIRLADEQGRTRLLSGRPGRTGVQLVATGLPRFTDDPVSQDAFDRLWLQGLPRKEIRTALQIGPKAVKAHAEMAPPRWTGKDIQTFFGWSPANHGLRLSRGHFPHPDGRDGSRDWWWPDTITTWAATQPFVRCPHCNASVARLKQHLTKHDRGGEQVA